MLVVIYRSSVFWSMCGNCIIVGFLFYMFCIIICESFIVVSVGLSYLLDEMILIIVWSRCVVLGKIFCKFCVKLS